MHHLVSAAVNPPLRLKTCIEQWPEISRALREPPRSRTLQTETLEHELKLF